MSANDTILTLGLAALGLYFSVLVAGAAWRYLRFRRLQGTALLTWPLPRPAAAPFLLGLGALAAALAVLHALLGRPFHHVYSQAVMAVYFMLVLPLSWRLRLGLYRDGIWAETGFLAWGDIARLAFRETPEIMLILLGRGRTGSLRLPVPPGEYGAVRKILEEKIRARELNVEAGLLGL